MDDGILDAGQLQERRFQHGASPHAWHYPEVGMVHASTLRAALAQIGRLALHETRRSGGEVEVDETFIGGKAGTCTESPSAQD